MKKIKIQKNSNTIRTNKTNPVKAYIFELKANIKMIYTRYYDTLKRRKREVPSLASALQSSLRNHYIIIAIVLVLYGLTFPLLGVGSGLYMTFPILLIIIGVLFYHLHMTYLYINHRYDVCEATCVSEDENNRINKVINKALVNHNFTKRKIDLITANGDLVRWECGNPQMDIRKDMIIMIYLPLNGVVRRSDGVLFIGKYYAAAIRSYA